MDTFCLTALCAHVCVCARIGSELEDLREAFILPFLTSGQHTARQNLSLWSLGCLLKCFLQKLQSQTLALTHNT